MRAVDAALLSLMCVACASTPDVKPREYLDEQTAATITVVAEPWIFSRERTNATLDERDYLNIHAIDVNRMGDHRQYFAVLQSLPLVDAAGRETPPPQLQLRAGEEIVTLESARDDSRALGLAQPVAQSYTAASKWWYFPVDKHTLARISRAQDVQASLVAGEVRAPYVLWRDGRAEAAALAAALP
jgi:hypothetical protein